MRVNKEQNRALTLKTVAVESECLNRPTNKPNVHIEPDQPTNNRNYHEHVNPWQKSEDEQLLKGGDARQRSTV